MDPYRQTTYQSDGIQIRIDKHHPILDNLLTINGCRSWAFLTAWNPDGRLCNPEENYRANRQMLTVLQQKQYIILTGWGVGDDRKWAPEASFLLLGIPEAEAISIGKAFKQRAIVIGNVGEPARLEYI